MTIDLDDASPIDFHGKLAVLELVVSSLVAGGYFVFSQFGVVAASLWKLVLAVQLFVSTVMILHYVMNRRPRRLWVEGIVSMLMLFPFLMIALLWLFYLLSIPIPLVLKVSVIAACFALIARHAFLVLSDFRRAAKIESVVQTIYHDNGKNLVLRHSCGGYIDGLTARNPLKPGVLSVVAYLTPLAAALGGNVNHVFDENIGPHVLCIVFSLLAFPMTLSLVGNFYVRQLFFRVYLPLKLERRTGKRIILAQ
ncbi:hypothetical protein [Burkholderia sp. AU15512]|uniref:hypothetical protein n=1 Tax=Burkholderia sp. AU15512 TaxID=2015345 RepID=UPI000B92390C|nr:hypothetical protein [Burkholderia sp. AU15512]OXI27420.1 hypothetical protein CFB43_02190 [Burkholderia sp. AU15512]